MRSFFFFCSILISLVALPATAAEPSKSQCDVIIGEALKMQDREAGLKLLNSKAVQECFRRFPGLDKKYFPIDMNKEGSVGNKDPMFTIKLR